MLNKEVRKQSINNVIGNFVGTAGIAFWLKHELVEISAQGKEGYIIDFLVTGFLLPAILGVIFMLWFRRRAARGEFDGSVIPSGFRLSWLPRGPWLAACTIAFLGLAFAALPLGIYLLLTGSQSLIPATFALVKGVWAAIAIGLVVPMAIYHGVAIANKPQAQEVSSDAEVSNCD
jgi:hypothetical protein